MTIRRDATYCQADRSLLRFSCVLDLETASARHLLGRRRNPDLQNAVLERRLRLIGDRPLGQRNRSMEAAVAALGAIHASALRFVFLPSLAGNRDFVLGDV